MENLSLTELRELYPSITARSKEDFLKKVNELEINDIEVDDPIEIDSREIYVDGSDELTWYNLPNFIFAECTGREKILIQTPSSIEADLLWTRINQEIIPQLNEKGINVMASSTRRDFHLNGTCYIRLVCKVNFEHIKRLINYTSFKTLT